MRIKKFGQFVLIFFIITGWVFSNWLSFFNSSLNIKKAEASITYQSAGAVTISNAHSVAFPASIASGDLLILLIGMKGTSLGGSSMATPLGWTAITSLVDAGGYVVDPDLTADQGDTSIFSFYKVADGTETGFELFEPTGDSTHWAQMYRFTNSNADWSVAGTTGSDVSTGTDISIGMSADPGVAGGDYVLGAMVVPTDAANPFSSEAFSQTGVTFGTVTEISEPDTALRNDLGGFVVEVPISSGTSSAAPSMTATATVGTNAKGPGIFIRVRATGTITYQSAGAISYNTLVGTDGVLPPYPASIASGNLLVLLVGMKPQTANGGSVTTPTGWTALTSLTGAGGYGTTLGADTGNTNIFSFYKVADGTETANLPVVLGTSGTNNVAWAQIYRLSNSSKAWSVAGTTGSDASTGTDISIGMSADPGVAGGDYVLGAMVVPTDAANPFSSEAFSQTGVTFGTVTEISEPDTATGIDLGGFVVEVPISSGTSSAAPSMTATATVGTNAKGPGIFIRTREVPPTFEQSAYRFFNNNNSTDVGSALASQDTSATLVSTGDAFRLRMLVHVGAGELASSGQNFKLQFALSNGVCDTSFSGETYADVTGATAIAYNNNATPADGDNLTSNANDPTHSGDTIVNQDYEEANNFTNTVGAIPVGQDGKWDFSLIDNGAPSNTAYCFRIRKSDDTNIDTYTVIPQITTSSGATQTLTFSISDNTIGFGTFSTGAARYATGDTTGSGTETEAHTIIASTNATNGYAITVNGTTLTYDGNTIDAIGGTNTASSIGTEQFGLRMTATGGTNASVTAPYAASGFALDTANFPDQVASDTDGDDVSTTYSVRYIGNIATSTRAGSYSSTLTYIITATY